MIMFERDQMIDYLEIIEVVYTAKINKIVEIKASGTVEETANL